MLRDLLKLMPLLLLTQAPLARAADSAALPPPAPVAGNAVALTLSDAIARALGTSTKVRQAEADLGAQVERRRGAWADVGPKVSLGYNQAKFVGGAATTQFGPETLLIRPAVSQTGMIKVTQPLTGAFALVDKAKFEGVQETVKEDSLQITKTDESYNAAEVWLQAYAAQRSVDIAEAATLAAQDQLKDSLAIERAGRLNHGDTLKIELNVSEARAQAAQAKAVRDTVFAALRVATDLPVGAPINLAGELPQIPAGVAADPDTAVKQALDKRLETQQAKSALDSAEFGKKLAYTNFTPTVDAFAEWDHTYGDLSSIGGFRDTKSYGIAANWPIWNNGAHVFAVREAAQNVAKADEARRGVDQAIRLDVLQALANLKASQESLALANVAVSQATEAYRIEKARFRTGTRSATDLILAETSKTSAQGRLVAAQTDVVRWHLKTQKALGADQPKL